MAAFVIAMLVDKGFLEYSQRISNYWPEFAKHGKEQISLSDVLRHESGLSTFNHVFKDEDNLRQNIKKNSIGEVIENCQQVFPNVVDGVDTKRAYHAITRGLILNELVRRVDPEKRYTRCGLNMHALRVS